MQKAIDQDRTQNTAYFTKAAPSPATIEARTSAAAKKAVLFCELHHRPGRQALAPRVAEGGRSRRFRYLIQPVAEALTAKVEEEGRNCLYPGSPTTQRARGCPDPRSICRSNK